MDKDENLRMEKIVLNYKIGYMKYNVDKLKFPMVTSLPPEIAVKMTDAIGNRHPRMGIERILTILEKDLIRIFSIE